VRGQGHAAFDVAPPGEDVEGVQAAQVREDGGTEGGDGVEVGGGVYGEVVAADGEVEAFEGGREFVDEVQL
jgi:hypothetical protein